MNIKKSNIGDKDLNYLIAHWPNDSFLHIDELAKIIQKAQIDGTLGFKPYNPKQKYEINDKIVVPQKNNNIYFASEYEIYEIIPSVDEFGDYYETIKIKPIGSKKKGLTYISCYTGEKNINAETVPPDEFVAAKYKDLIHELVSRLKGNKKFDCFKDYWIPRNKINQQTESEFQKRFDKILFEKRKFCTKDLINNSKNNADQGIDKNTLLNYNYFLSKIKYLKRNSEIDILNYQWDCKKKLSTKIYNYHIDVNKRTIKIDEGLETYFAYNGYLNTAQFIKPNGEKLQIEFNLNTEKIKNEDLYKVVFNNLHRNRAVEFSSNFRGDIIKISQEPINLKWTITVKREWIESGYLKINDKISKFLEQVNNIEIYYNEDNKIVTNWDSIKNQLVGLKNWYQEKAITNNYQIKLQLYSLYPPKFRIWTEYEKDPEQLFEHPTAEEKDWRNYRIRDCIYWVLKKLDRESHYREIWLEIKKHKEVSIKSIISELYNNPELFNHLGEGKWLLGKSENNKKKGKNYGEFSGNSIVITSEVWNYVVEIEQNDLVYKILKETKDPLSFHEICTKIIKYFPQKNISIAELKQTGFLNADDERLERTQTGEWILTEWLWIDIIEEAKELHSQYKLILNKLTMLTNN